MKNLSILSCAMVVVFCSMGMANSSVIFETDFESGVPAEFSGITTLENIQGYAGFGFDGLFLRNSTGGDFGGGGGQGVPSERTTLTLTELAPHSSINIKFLLAIIDSWDGDAGLDPDIFNVRVDGGFVFSETLSNRPPSTYIQSYKPPPGVLLTTYPFENLGFREIYPDSAYDMSLDPTFNDIPHSDNTLTIEWYASGAGWQGGIDESWALENVRIETNPVPIPSAVWLLGSGLITFAGIRYGNKFKSQKQTFNGGE